MRRKLTAVGAVLTAGTLAFVALVLFAPQASAAVGVRGDKVDGIVGAWYVDTIGAPFLPHAMAFTSDGQVFITNPDAAEAGNSSSAGMGAWVAQRRDVAGKFLEVNANKAGPQANKFWSNLIVTFKVTVRGDRFEGPALATYYDGEGHPIAGLTNLDATLKGQRITVDSPAPVVFVP